MNGEELQRLRDVAVDKLRFALLDIKHTDPQLYDGGEIIGLEPEVVAGIQNSMRAILLDAINAIGDYTIARQAVE